MKWYKHIVDSGDDPDIDDAITLFGADGYYVFFRTLEVMGREFNINNPGVNMFSVEFLRKKYRISWGKVVKILSFYQEKGRIFYELLNDNRLPSIRLNCPKLQELTDEYTQKGLKKMSGQTPDLCRDKVTIEEEEDKDKREKKGKKEIIPRQKYLDSVLLTDQEYKKLQEVLGQKNLDSGIEQLDYSITVKGGKYKDHYKTLLNWFKRGFLTKGNGEQATRQKPERLPTQAEELAAFNERWERDHVVGACDV